MIENRVPDPGVTRVIPNGQYQPYAYNPLPLDLREPRSAIGSSYTDSLYHAKALTYVQPQFARPLPNASKVTNSFRAAHDMPPKPMNLVQKATPAPETFSHFRNAPWPYHLQYPYSPFNGCYLQASGTPSKNVIEQTYYDTSPPVLPVPVSSPVKASFEVKNPPVLINDKHSFKVPSDSAPTKARHNANKLKRASDPPASFVSHSTPAPRPAVEEMSPEIASILADSNDIALPEDELERFRRGACVWSHMGWKNVTVDEHVQKFFLEKNLARRVEQSTVEYIISGVTSGNKYNLDFHTVVGIKENKETDKVVLTLVCEKGTKREHEKPTAYPFLVRGRGWCSYSPDKTEKILGWCGGKLQEGDVLLCISEKKTANQPKKPTNVVRVEQQQNGHHESKVSPPYKNDLNPETRSNNSDSASTRKRKRNNDTNNNTDKNAAEDSEASRNKTRRWSAPDPCIEKYR